MKDSTFYAKLYRRCFFFETPNDDVMTSHLGQAMIKVYFAGEVIKVKSFENSESSDKAFFLGPNRHQFALDYVDGLKELLS